MYNECSFAKKEKYSIEDLLNIMEKLRSPQGCPWDREQNHKSIKREFIEECYEAVEAIDTDDTNLLREELGDVLLQVVFHCEMEKEIGSFEFSDVVDELARKLVVRHPHVFSDTVVTGTDDVLTNWDKIKMTTKGQGSLKDTFKSITTAMPALMRNQKYTKKAIKYNVKDFDKEINVCVNANSNMNEIGEALAKIVAVAQQNGIDAEEALAKFTKEEIEKIVI